MDGEEDGRSRLVSGIHLTSNSRRPIRALKLLSKHKTHLLNQHPVTGLSVQVGLLVVQELPEWLVQILSNVRQEPEEKEGG